MTGRNDDIYPVLTAFSDILRYSISFEQEMVELDQEISYLESYISIQNSRFDNRIRFIKEISDTVKQSYIPKLILQPIVENCIEHGLAPKRGDWIIRLLAYEETVSESVVISISDNGIGMTAGQLKEVNLSLQCAGNRSLSKSAHIGLSNVHSRIQIQSGPEYGLSVQSIQNVGTTITIKTRKM